MREIIKKLLESMSHTLKKNDILEQTNNTILSLNNEIIPSIEELLKACSDYFKTTGRRVTFEYSMISGVNDSDENARELAKRLEGTQSHVNLIPVNTVEGTGYLKSNIKRQQAFINILAAKNIGATVRRTLGSDINASCGQLKRKHIEEGGK